jgi:hypothetical protein
MFLDNQYDPGIPIYTQIMRRIQRRILTGEWGPGARVPAVRDLAVEFGVNPNTMQRALSELEREGLLFSERTSGRFITRDAALIEETRRQMAEEAIEAFLKEMKELGYTKAALRRALDERPDF